MVVQRPAVLPTYYQLLLNAKTETWIAEIQQIFVFNIPFFGWCNRKWVVESRCQILWVWEKESRKSRKSIQDVEKYFNPQSWRAECLCIWFKPEVEIFGMVNSKCVQGYYVSSRNFAATSTTTTTVYSFPRNSALATTPNTTCLTSLKISSLYFIFRQRISFFIFKRRLAAEEGSFSKKTWVQKISRGRWAPCGPGRRQWYRRGRQEAPMVGIYFLA